MIGELFGCLACLAIGVMIGWIACRIKLHERQPTPTVTARPQPDADFPNPGRYEAGSRAEKNRKAATYAPVPKPFDKKDRSTWPVVPVAAIPELRKPQPKMSTNVRKLQMRLAFATEMIDTMGYGAELRDGIAELDAIAESHNKEA